MSDGTPATGESDLPVTGPDDQPVTGDEDKPATGTGGRDLHDEVERFKAEARKWEDRSKANATAAKELEQLRRQSMSDNERAVAEAVAATRAEMVTEFGGRLVAAEVRAAAAGRQVDVDALLDGLDRRRFVTDDGEPDTKAIRAWLDKIAPVAAFNGGARALDLGQGQRGPGRPAETMNDLLRRGRG